MLTAVMVGSITLVSDAFLRGRLKGMRRNAIFMIIAIILAIIAPFSAMMLQMSVSRKREFMADASSVEFTRNPEVLASALAKIALDPVNLDVENRATQHLYIINPIKKFNMRSSSLFATHPPTEARINALKRMGAILGEHNAPA